MAIRYRADDLRRFAGELFSGAGMPADRARVVGELLVEGDLIGQTTHGLALAGGYLAALEDGSMAKDGMPEVVNDKGATVVWDGGYLSGVWLVWHGLQTALSRIEKYGSVTIAIRRSHHIACLSAYLPHATERGMMMILASSDPDNSGVAPYGSYEPVFTPDPIAVGYPTTGEPVLIDMSASTTTLGMAGRLMETGAKFEGDWLIGPDGKASNDPNVLDGDPPGALLPLGGLDRGHKGFALALMVEALTSALAGYGRADKPGRWGASVFLQVIDPQAFGGLAAFERETGWLAEACRRAAVPAGQPPVRLPGSGALKRKRQALAEGVELYATILPTLAPWAGKLGVALPETLT